MKAYINIRYNLAFTIITLLLITSNRISCNKLELVQIKDMADVAESLSISFLKNIQQLFNAKNFIETGTFLGRTAERAASIFQRVHTVELSKDLFEKAVLYLSKYRNTQVHLGSSSQILGPILKAQQGKTILWLDAHYSGPNHAGFTTACGGVNTPIIEELLAVRASGIKDAVIMIDDLRLFDNLIQPQSNNTINLSNPAFHHFTGYPSLTVITALIKTINPHYNVYVLGDVLIAFTEKNIQVSPIIKACTISRLYNGNNYPLQAVLSAEHILSRAAGSEKSVIDDLFNTMGSIEILTRFGIGKHFILWKALTLRYSNPSKAFELFKYTNQVGLNDARIASYLAETLRTISTTKA